MFGEQNTALALLNLRLLLSIFVIREVIREDRSLNALMELGGRKFNGLMHWFYNVNKAGYRS